MHRYELSKRLLMFASGLTVLLVAFLLFNPSSAQTSLQTSYEYAVLRIDDPTRKASGEFIWSTPDLQIERDSFRSLYAAMDDKQFNTNRLPTPQILNLIGQDGWKMINYETSLINGVMRETFYFIRD